VTAGFTPVTRCWVCDGDALERLHDAPFHLPEFANEDPELATYTGLHADIMRCRVCGFAQPSMLPSLPGYFDRMYNQQWSEDWVAREHEATYKDLIFRDILSFLDRRVRSAPRRLLDVGAHAGRFVALARKDGWEAEGLELNARTAAFAAQASSGRVHHGNLFTATLTATVYDAVTLTDVLEHMPDPRKALRRAFECLRPGGWIAIKVPNAPAQRLKERAIAAWRRGYTPRLADNLVHVNHFSSAALARALREEGFSSVTVRAAAPEFPEGVGLKRPVDHALRLVLFHVSRAVPGGDRTPLAMNLQAYAQRT
jgi:SAM-dependent methyltransferase